MHISIEKGKTLIIRLMAIGPVVEGKSQRDVWFEVNGEVCFEVLRIIGGTNARVGSGCICRGQQLCGRDSLAREGFSQRARIRRRAYVWCCCRSQGQRRTGDQERRPSLW
jgi:hypothetical protein